MKERERESEDFLKSIRPKLEEDSIIFDLSNLNQTKDKLMLLDLNKDEFIRCRAISFAIFIYLIYTSSFFLLFS